LVKEYRDAKTEKDKQELFKVYGGKLVKWAKDNPKDTKALEALNYVMQLPAQATPGSPKAEALALLRKEYAKSPRIATYLSDWASSDDAEVATFVKEVFEKNPDKKVRVQAGVAFVEGKEQNLGMAYWAKADSTFRARYEKFAGKEATKKMIDSIPANEKELKTFLTKLRTDFKGEFKDLFVGAPMPELQSEDLKGNKVKLSDLKGKVVVLDIWATWCPPCRAMIPHERDLVKRFKDKPFVLVSISFDAKKETLTEFLEKESMPWTHWWNGTPGSIGKELNIKSFPTIFVLDGKGVIRYKGTRDKAMDLAVETLLKEAEAEKASKTE